MQIDWLTVAAQIVNFLVLVWLLQHFLYGPITRAMARREKRIADRLGEAADEKEAAEREAEKYRQKQAELDDQREQIMADARSDAEEQRNALEREARNGVEQRKQAWLEQLDEQRESFLKDVEQQLVERFYALSRQAVRELANAELESQLAGVFVERLHALDRQTRQKIARACKDADNTIVVSSRFELSSNDRRRITTAIHEEIRDAAEVEYRESEEIACGIELKAGSRVVAWSVDAYIDGVRQEAGRKISELTGASASRKEAAG